MTSMPTIPSQPTIIIPTPTTPTSTTTPSRTEVKDLKDSKEFKETDTKIISTYALHVQKQICIGLDFGNINADIRRSFKEYNKHYANHVFNIQNLFRTAMTGLKGTAVVFGCGLIEPAAELTLQFKKPVFVDYDKLSLNDVIKSIEVTLKAKDKADGTKKSIKAMKNVISFQHDLTGGGCDAINNTVAELLKQIGTVGCTEKEFVHRIITVMNKFEVNPTRLANVKELQQVNFVSSLLVMSQLYYHLHKYANDIFVGFFKSKLLSHPEYKDAYKQFKAKLCQQHLYDLSACVAPGGRIFFADTFKHVTPKESFDVVSPEITKKIKSIFKIIAEKEWSWLYKPEQNESYLVTGYILEKMDSPVPALT